MIEVRLPSGLMVQTGYSQWAEPVGCNPDVPVGKVDGDWHAMEILVCQE